MIQCCALHTVAEPSQVPGPAYFLLQLIENHIFFYINKNTGYPGFHRALHCTFLEAFFHLLLEHSQVFCSVLICLVIYSHLYLIVIYFVEIFEPVLTSTYSTYSTLLYILRTDLNARPVKNTQTPVKQLAHI